MFDGLSDLLIDLINYLVMGIGMTLQFVIELFPNSPFANPTTPPPVINLGWITWLLPFPTMFVHATALGSAILIYYSIRVLARWVKMVRS